VDEEIQFDLNKSTYSIQQEFTNMSSLKNASIGILSSPVQTFNAADLKSISERLSLNYNVFSLDSGKLIYTSLPELFKREIIADRLDYATLKNLRSETFGNMIDKGQVGLLRFLSSYFIVHNDEGKELGIVELPFFLSNSNQRSETTTIITTLINIYIFVFLISAVLAFFLTQSVTKPFNYIIKQFTKINLTKTNEPLKWFDSDEIGVLIKEYNRMLRKLENSTVLLAKNEREMAWREMAKQVAHEIKNPLTPMKLSLQMLERAIKNNATNVNEIAVKVTKTLVEQIDNLSLIATNFSNFAKLPSSKKEVFPLNEFLYSVTGMYHDDQQNEFLFMIPEYEIMLFADKSQIIRVFTNVIQNAIQSIPEDKKGNIALTVSKIKNNFVRISISDNGEGISEEKGKSLFQPYFTTKTSGTGLGLAMCKDIIEESGGKISFESVIEEGTVFHIDLPVHIAEQD
jgi:nitrogen fixation/metabolism regulation signal transduction histidine kinase